MRNVVCSEGREIIGICFFLMYVFREQSVIEEEDKPLRRAHHFIEVIVSLRRQ
jgi:hypothetical protein